MRIFTVWEAAPDETDMPWLVASTDEYTVESLGCYPDEYKAALAYEGSARRRELIIEIPGSAVIKLFQAPVVKGNVE